MRVIGKPFWQAEDVLDKLPGVTREKLVALRDAAESARAISKISYERIKELGSKRAATRAQLEQLSANSRSRSDDPSIAEGQKLLEKIERDLAAQQTEYSARQERARPLGQLVRRCESYISEVSSIELAPPTPLPKLAGPIVAEVEKIRARIADHKRAIRVALNAPIPSAEAKRRAIEEIDQLAQRGEPDTLGLVEGARSIVWPSIDIPASLIAGPNGGGVAEGRTETDTFGLFAWLHRDALVAKISALIERDADDGHALTDPQRAAIIKKSKTDMLADERIEEALITLGEQQGQMIVRREDCDVRAVLHLLGRDAREF